MTHIKIYAQTFKASGQNLHASLQNRTAVLALAGLAGLSQRQHRRTILQAGV